jgi:CheY-like chemotaxis protein
LMVIGCLGNPNLAEPARYLLTSPDSRVRAWACFALGQFKDEQALEQIYALNADHSNRVRIHAWQAVQAIVGPEESQRHFGIRIPQHESLILISEDSRRMQQQLKEIYQRMGYRVITAATEEETITAALKLQPQAIITDNQKGADNLSGLNMTWDICRHLELRETILFMLTADFVEPVFLWQGGDFFLSKFKTQLADIAQIVNEYLHH